MTSSIFKMFLMCCWISSSVHAQVLLIPTQKVDPPEFEAALKNLPDRISIPEHYLKETPKIHNVELLNEHYAKAQASFLSLDDTQFIQSQFENVLKLELEDDWKEAQRRIFLLSYLRLIQLNLENPLQEENLAKWSMQALIYLEELEAPKDLIPPPVMEKIEKTKQQLSLKEILIPNVNLDQILIQGRSHNARSSILTFTPERKVRVTYLSKFHKPETHVLALSSLEKFIPLNAPWIQGECAEAKFIDPAPEAEIYKSLNCKKMESPSKEIQLNALSKATQEDFKPNYNRWIWIGAGLVATALIIQNLNQNKSSSTSATESHGF